MAKLVLLLSVYYLYTSLLLLNNSNAFTLELIHPNSITTSSSIRNQTLNKIARPIVDLQELIYMAKIGIGTFKSKPPFAEYYLHVVTGSSFTWMQCEGCKSCFKQKPKPFPKKNSTSFHPILDDVTKKPSTYYVSYLDGTMTYGIKAKETLHLNSNTGSKKTQVQEFIFGCCLENTMQYGRYKNNIIAGVLGLGWGPYSFVDQIKESKGKFSYCFPLATKTRAKTYLRFGDDIVHASKNPSSTTITMVEGSQAYYINLQGISINMTRLNISKDVVALKLNGPGKDPKGGCVIDSGTTYSYIVGPAYDKLKEGLQSYFSKDKNLIRMYKGYSDLDLCYERRKSEGFKNLPDITFHFEGSKSDFHVRPQGGFKVFRRFESWKLREYVCLAMLRLRYGSIIGTSHIGTYQQTNQRIILDTQKKKLIFHPEDCSKNP